MQLCSLAQGTMPPWSIVPRCPRVLQVLPTMSDSWDCESLDTWELSDIVGSTCNTLGQRGTMLHGGIVPCPKEQSCIVWTDLQSTIRSHYEQVYHAPISLSNVSILDSANSKISFKNLESLYIFKNKPVLNKTDRAFNLKILAI